MKIWITTFNRNNRFRSRVPLDSHFSSILFFQVRRNFFETAIPHIRFSHCSTGSKIRSCRIRVDTYVSGGLPPACRFARSMRRNPAASSRCASLTTSLVTSVHHPIRLVSICELGFGATTKIIQINARIQNHFYEFPKMYFSWTYNSSELLSRRTLYLFYEVWVSLELKITLLLKCCAISGFPFPIWD